jgi:hypothetical protein
MNSPLTELGFPTLSPEFQEAGSSTRSAGSEWQKRWGTEMGQNQSVRDLGSRDGKGGARKGGKTPSGSGNRREGVEQPLRWGTQPDFVSRNSRLRPAGPAESGCGGLPSAFRIPLNRLAIHRFRDAGARRVIKGGHTCHQSHEKGCVGAADLCRQRPTGRQKMHEYWGHSFPGTQRFLPVLV